jgi:hypothetical protein
MAVWTRTLSGIGDNWSKCLSLSEYLCLSLLCRSYAWVIFAFFNITLSTIFLKTKGKCIFCRIYIVNRNVINRYRVKNELSEVRAYSFHYFNFGIIIIGGNMDKSQTKKKIVFIVLSAAYILTTVICDVIERMRGIHIYLWTRITFIMYFCPLHSRYTGECIYFDSSQCFP